MGVSYRRAAADVLAGRADYAPLQPNVAHLRTFVSKLAARYGPGSRAARAGDQRYFVDPQPSLDYFALNTHRPLFADARMRQAASYAIDRRALAMRGDGFQPVPERETDHYLPPGIPGYRDVHVYPATPDVAKAKQLARGATRTAILYTCNLPPCPEQAQIVKNDLAVIGLHVQVKTFPPPSLFARMARPGESFDLAFGAWLPDYVDPAGMLNPLLDNSTVLPKLKDSAYQQRLAAASQLAGPERYLTYGKLDLNLARYAAPLLAFGNPSNHDFFAKRMGCETNGAYGIDLGALCLRS